MVPQQDINDSTRWKTCYDVICSIGYRCEQIEKKREQTRKNWKLGKTAIEEWFLSCAQGVQSCLA